MMSPMKSRLKLINEIVSSNAGFESDLVQVDIYNGRKVIEREKILAELVGDIYKITHPIFSTCEHPDWELSTEKEIIKRYDKKGI